MSDATTAGTSSMSVVKLRWDEMGHPLRATDPPVQSTTQQTSHNITNHSSNIDQTRSYLIQVGCTSKVPTFHLPFTVSEPCEGGSVHPFGQTTDRSVDRGRYNLFQSAVMAVSKVASIETEGKDQGTPSMCTTKHVTIRWRLRKRKLACSTRSGANACDKKNVRLWRAYEVFCLHSPSRARLSRMSVRAEDEDDVCDP